MEQTALLFVHSLCLGSSWLRVEWLLSLGCLTTPNISKVNVKYEHFSCDIVAQETILNLDLFPTVFQPGKMLMTSLQPTVSQTCY